MCLKPGDDQEKREAHKREKEHRVENKKNPMRREKETNDDDAGEGKMTELPAELLKKETIR